MLLQRQTIKQINQISGESDKRFDEIEVLRKAAADFRDESLEAQKAGQSLLKDQLETVLKVNEGFRKDLDRVIDKQDSLRDNIKSSIDIGLQEIREKLYEVSVKEIVSEIPSSFRSDLEKELSEASERIVRRMLSRLKNSPSELVEVDAVREIVERASQEMMHGWRRFQDEWHYHLRELRDIPPEHWERYARDHGIPFPMGMHFDERYIDFLAERIAYNLERRRW